MQGYSMPVALFPRGRRGLPLYEYKQPVDVVRGTYAILVCI
jgi:hypothetical protein